MTGGPAPTGVQFQKASSGLVRSGALTAEEQIRSIRKIRQIRIPEWFCRSSISASSALFPAVSASSNEQGGC